MPIDANIPLQAGSGVPAIDPMGNAAAAYSLAGTMVDTQEKIRQRNEGVNDRDALQNYLTSGGDLSTPEGSKKAVQELQGKVSPQFTEKLLAHSDQVTNNFLKQKQMMYDLDVQHLTDMKAQEEQAAPMLEQLGAAYKTTLATKGQPAADAEFAQNKQQLMTWMGQQQLGGKPRFTPDVVQSFQQITPDSLPYLVAQTKYHSQLIDDRLKESRAKALEGGKATIYTDGKREFKQTEDGMTYEHVNGEWQRVEGLPPGAKKYGSTGSGDAGGTLDPGAKTTAAMNYVLTGQLPTRMSGEQKTEIMNEGEKLRKASGLSNSEWAVVQFDTKAKAKALGNLENLNGQVDAFEKSLNSYVQRAVQNLGSIDSSDIPRLNEILQNVDKEFTGLPPALARLQLNLRAIAGEYNKLSSGAMGNTQPGEKSLLDIQSMFKKSDNPDTLRATLDEVLQDGKFRSSGIRRTADTMRSSISKRIEPGQDATKVNPTDQKAADTDRVKILRDELTAAMTRVNSAKNEDEKRRAQGDVEAVRKELRSAGASSEEAPAKKGKTRELTINGKKITVQVD